jgi:Family of unknown function (DUF6521)
MTTWSERPHEEATLLNPDFCALILTLAVGDFEKESGAGMPYVFAFLLLPIILHKPTREALPKSTLKVFSTWLEENEDLRATFSDRVQTLRDFVKEAVLFASIHGAITFASDGILKVGKKPRGIQPFGRSATEEVRDCLHKAQFLGRWMSTAGPAATVMALWGVRP